MKLPAHVRCLVVCIASCLVVACDKGGPLPAVPESKSSFQRIVFTEPNAGDTFTLVSPTECEIKSRGNIALSEYSREDNRLRVVTRSTGGAVVNYYEVSPDTLRESTSGLTYYLPEALNQYHKQAAQEELAAANRVVQLRLLEVEARKSTQTILSTKDDDGDPVTVTNSSVDSKQAAVYEPTWYGDVLCLKYRVYREGTPNVVYTVEVESFNRPRRICFTRKDVRDTFAADLNKAITDWNAKYSDVRERPYQGILTE